MDSDDPLLFSSHKKTARDIALAGAHRITELCDDKGKFTYAHNPLTGEDQEDYNVIRHCITTWALFEAYERYGQDKKYLDTAKRALTFLRKVYVRPYLDHKDRMCVLSELGTIKLGAQGCAIIILCKAYETTGGQEFLNEAIQIGYTVLDMRRKRGEFYHELSAQTGHATTFKSPFYVGEALLGLCALYTTTQDEGWLNMTEQSLTRLAERNYGVTEQSHWMLYALNAFDTDRPNDSFLDYAKNIARNMMESPDYLESGYSTHIAVHSEGLLCFLNMLIRRKDNTYKTLYEEFLKLTEICLHKQAEYFRPDGNFVEGDSSSWVRIDYIQHNILAFMMYDALPEAYPE